MSSTCSAGPRTRPPIARDAVAIGAKVLWLQEDIVSEEAAPSPQREART